MRRKHTFTSDISKKEFPLDERIFGSNIRTPILNLIQSDYPEFIGTCSLSLSELNFYREKYISTYITKDLQELNELRDVVLNAHSEPALISDKIDDENDTELTLGQRMADRVAEFGGSWYFIICFFAFLLIWMVVNTVFLISNSFDPYPFILLNLILSTIAALQAPIIMMSQNRQEQKDRERARKDYLVNLKSELEIRILHEKLDYIIMKHQRDLIEIQQQQLRKMDDILSKIQKS